MYVCKKRGGAGGGGVQFKIVNTVKSTAAVACMYL